MADPTADPFADPFAGLFAALRAAEAAAAAVLPEPDFAARLRRRVERALDLPRGVVPVTTTETTTETTTVEVTARPRGAAVPYLAVHDARRALEWYADVLGARVVGEPIVAPDGRVGHAELALAGGTLYLADEHPELGVVAPAGGASVSLMLDVDDADAVRERALAGGATGDRPPYDGYGTRNAWIVDPFGHRWCLQSPLPARRAAYRHGDFAYVSLQTPDTERAVRFYRAVLGWEVVDGRRVPGRQPAVGFWSEPSGPTLFCCFAVHDVEAARERVAAAGGSAGPAERTQHGVIADCVDDQGTPFALWQIDDEPGGKPDLAYVTFQVPDATAARAFYGAVLGWRFTPGTVPDGWQVQGPTPHAGFSGGHDRVTTIPMWQVDDIAAAVERVRAAGGTATDPERQPYGVTSECTDDQGMRFYLGEL